MKAELKSDFVSSYPTEIATHLLPQTRQVIIAMSDVTLCDRSRISFDKRSLCLEWATRSEKWQGKACVKWSKDKVGKDDYLAELSRRHIGEKECDEIMSTQSQQELWSMSDEKLCKKIKSGSYQGEKKEELTDELTRRNYETYHCDDIIHFIHKPAFVVIDTNNPAFTVFISRSFKQLSQSAVREIIDHINVLDLNEFLNNAPRHIQQHIKFDAYKDGRIVGAFCNALKKKPIPIGLTWDGGIAFTYGDYRYAEQTYKKYKHNPEEYMREQDASADPVRPSNHIPFLLNF